VIYSKKLSKEFISIFLVILIVAVTNYVSFLFFLDKSEESLQELKKHFAQKIERLIAEDFSKILASEDTTDFLLIKNFIVENRENNDGNLYISNNILRIERHNKRLTVDVSNIGKLLDYFAKNTFIYEVNIGDVTIFSNVQGEISEEAQLVTFLSKYHQMKIKVKHDDSSTFITQSNLKLSRLTYAMVLTSIVVVMILIFIILYLSKQKNELSKTSDLLKNAKLFLKENKKFILRCYQHSKKQSPKECQEYFPISIVSENSDKKFYIVR
jgi:hypothetical protein